MIKVLQITAALREGGVETLLHSFYECVDKEQFHFDMACFSYADGVYREKFEALGCSIFALPSKKHLLKSAKALYSVLKEGRYDIVHVHQDDLSFLSILVAWKAKVPVRIVHSHLGKYPHSLLRGMISAITIPIMFRMANGYFACSEKAKKEFYPARLQDRVFVMQNGIPMERFRFSEETRKEVRAECGFTDDQTVIGSIARMTDQKDPLYLVEVFRLLHEANPNYRLLMLGDGLLREAVEQRIAAYGLQGVCVLTGARNDAWRFYNALDVFCLPSSWEGLGISFVEAAGPAAFITRIRAILLRDTGATLSPIHNFIFLQGLETLSLRVERHVENTLKVIDYLKGVDLVESISHPSLSEGLHLHLPHQGRRDGSAAVHR